MGSVELPLYWNSAGVLLVSQEKWLPQYTASIEEAKKRMKAKKKIATREGYKGAARLKTKTVDEMSADREAAKKNASAADKAEKRPAAK